MSIPINYQQIHITPDGNCQYRAIAFGVFGDENKYKRIKVSAINYIVEHHTFFSDFVDNILEYITEMKEENEYGDELTLMAISMNYDIHIKVFDLEDTLISQYNEDGEQTIELYFENEHYDYRGICYDDQINQVNQLGVDTYINDIIEEVQDDIDWKELIKKENFPWYDQVFIDKFASFIFN